MSDAHPSDMTIMLARAWRALGLLGQTDAIFNHISQSWFDDDGRHFMAMNSGKKFAADINGTDIQVFSVDILHPPVEADVNVDGFELHREIHKIRGRPGIALHTHSPNVAAVSAMENGLLPLSQAALEFVGHLKYFRYDGRFRDGCFSEGLMDLAREGGVAILINHGDLIVDESLEEVVYLAYYLEEACRIQCAALSSGQKLRSPSIEVVATAGESLARDRPLLAPIFFEALCKRLGVDG